MAKKFTLSLTAIALAASLVYASPYYAVYQMKQAAQTHDAQTLNEYVDYPVLRQNLKTTINQKMQQILQENKDQDLLSVMAKGIANKLSDMMIDAMVTPEGLTAMINGRKPDAATAESKKTATEKPKENQASDAPRINYHYRGLNNFSVVVSDATGKQTANLIFQRHGVMSWKLNGIEF